MTIRNRFRLYFRLSKKEQLPKELNTNSLSGFLGFLGGGMGVLCGIRQFHHKTKHKKFYLGVPILLVLQIALICYFGFI